MIKNSCKIETRLKNFKLLKIKKKYRIKTNEMKKDKNNSPWNSTVFSNEPDLTGDAVSDYQSPVE